MGTELLLHLVLVKLKLRPRALRLTDEALFQRLVLGFLRCYTIKV
ncbi:hypothetical protein [Petroclostridium sp. X23]|nr:hypothetical protein [Petroclostridium sp. X23]WHH56959.1 hypothetical protein QKW49_13990 [Petroclostridium sp. X23]